MAQKLMYIKIAVLLSAITAIEVAYPYLTAGVESLAPFYMPVLGILSSIKFFIVVGYYMHLKYDPPILKTIFYFSLALAFSFIVSMLLLL